MLEFDLPGQSSERESQEHVMAGRDSTNAANPNAWSTLGRKLLLNPIYCRLLHGVGYHGEYYLS